MHWIIRNQIGRRNLPKVERIKLAKLLVEPAAKEQAKESQKRKPNSVRPESAKQTDSTKEVADAAGEGVGCSMVTQYNAVEKADPELLEVAKLELDQGRLGPALTALDRFRRVAGIGQRSRRTRARVEMRLKPNIQYARAPSPGSARQTAIHMVAGRGLRL